MRVVPTQSPEESMDDDDDDDDHDDENPIPTTGFMALSNPHHLDLHDDTGTDNNVLKSAFDIDSLAQFAQEFEQTLPDDDDDGEDKAAELERHRLAKIETNTALRKLLLATAISASVALLELIGGIISGSIAVIADASHDIFDSGGFALSALFLWIGQFRGTSLYSFGWKRAEVVGAVVSVMLIWTVAIIMLVEAVFRIVKITSNDPTYQMVRGEIMFAMGLVGLSSNLILLKVLGGHGHSHFGGGHSHGGRGHSHNTTTSSSHGHSHNNNNNHHPHTHGHSHTEHDHGHSHNNNNHHHKEDNTSPQDLNVETGYAHALGHVIQDMGLVIAGIVIWARPDTQLTDPIMTIIFALFGLQPTFSILRHSFRLLMLAAPDNEMLAMIRNRITALDLVVNVHELHVWSLTSNMHFLSVHVCVQRQCTAEDISTIQRHVQDIAQDEFEITHFAIQIELQASKKICTGGGEHVCFEFQQDEGA